MTPDKRFKRVLKTHIDAAHADLTKANELVKPLTQDSSATVQMSPSEAKRINRAIETCLKCLKKVMVKL